MAQSPATTNAPVATLSPRDRQLILSGLAKLKATYERQVEVNQNNPLLKDVYAQSIAEIRAIEVIL